MNNQNQTDATEDRDFRDALLSSIGTTGDGCENAISGRPLLNISHDFQSDLVAETAREMIRGAESFGILGEGSPDLISPEARIRYGAEAVSETVSALKSVIATLQHAVKKSAYAKSGAGRQNPTGKTCRVGQGPQSNSALQPLTLPDTFGQRLSITTGTATQPLTFTRKVIRRTAATTSRQQQ